jgi:stearoyl-CoA desaturase (Delta-9 desaturase)
MDSLMSVWDGLINLLANGLLEATWWQVVLATLVFTHITIASVTIFLHSSCTRYRRISSAFGCG